MQFQYLNNFNISNNLKNQIKKNKNIPHYPILKSSKQNIKSVSVGFEHLCYIDLDHYL